MKPQRFVLFTVLVGIIVLLMMPHTQAQSPVPPATFGPFNAVIANQASALEIRQNAEDDFSLKIISGNGSKDVTIIRLQGPDAEAGIQEVYFYWRTWFSLMQMRAAQS